MPSTELNESSVHTGLLDQLPIVTEATTSRAIINNPLFRHVVFSMDAGQVLTEHASPRAVVVTMLSGRINFTVGGQDHIIATGDTIYLAPNDRHALTAIEPSHMALTLIVPPDGE